MLRSSWKLSIHIFLSLFNDKKRILEPQLPENHEYIRKFVPQGKSFDGFTQKDINLMMSHINSVKRDSLGGKSPFECLSKKEMRIVKKLGLRLIPPDEVILNPSLFK